MDFLEALLEEIKKEDGKVTFFDIAMSDWSKYRVEIGHYNSEMNILELIEPLNFQEEKEKWIKQARAGNFTNPRFVYDIQALKDAAGLLPAINELTKKLMQTEALTKRDNFEQAMLLKVLNDARLTAEIAKAILDCRDYDISRHVREKYDFGSLSYDRHELLSACSSPEKSTEFPEKNFTAEKIADVFELSEKRYGFNWPIFLSDTAAAIDVRDKSRNGPCIVIPSSRTVNAEKLLRLVGHEIESHLRSSMNGTTLFGFGGLEMKTDNEVLYEGLAMLSDQDFDLWANGMYAGPLIWYLEAIELASKGYSFALTAKRLLELRDPNSESDEKALTRAFNTTYRVFRGITDCENPFGYAFTKDVGYFIGYQTAKRLKELGYDWLLELGSFDPSQLLLIAKTFKLSPEIIPYERIDLKRDANFITTKLS